MLGQIIRIVVVLLLVWLVFRALRRFMAKRSRADAPAITEMLPCAHCGTHIPKSQALMAAEKAYCSRQHLEADQDKLSA